MSEEFISAVKSVIIVMPMMSMMIVTVADVLYDSDVMSIIA